MLDRFVAAPLAQLLNRRSVAPGEDANSSISRTIPSAAASSRARAPVKCDEKLAPYPPYMPVGVKHVFGAYDVASVRRGYEVYRQVCATCHSMKHFRFKYGCSDDEEKQQDKGSCYRTHRLTLAVHVQCTNKLFVL